MLPQAFREAAPPGSWLVLLPEVRHVQLFDTGDLTTNCLLDKFDGLRDKFDGFPGWLR